MLVATETKLITTERLSYWHTSFWLRPLIYLFANLCILGSLSFTILYGMTSGLTVTRIELE